MTLASVLVVLLLPLYLMVWVVMGIDMLFRSSDRGPWLYRELRISRGREFDLLKFRTLRTDGLRRGDSAEEAHARLDERNETNLTWAGRRVLRPWYLDELPQLWNVLRGDMSLVGPRPWPPSMVAKQVESGLTYRTEFVAGWTGPSQVQKGVIESAGYAQLDAEYVNAIRSASALRVVRLDVSLLWRTVLVMVKGEGLQF
jgi:lipopolysaccharide/colanic/teichoic acid biosynthesis glycosyltransferase